MARLTNCIASRYCVAAASASQTAMLRWFDAPRGRRVLEAQRSLCRGLPVPPGFRLAHLGVSPRHGVADCFTQPCRFTFVQETDAGVDAVSRFDALPLPSDTFDVVVLHHALDFCQQPQRVLAEAARIIRPGGRIVLIGLSPYSLLGLGKWLLAPWHAAGVWRHNSLRSSRVCDWLVLLGFGLDSGSEVSRSGAVSWSRLTKLPKRALQRLSLSGPDTFYVLTAYKRAIPLQPHANLPWLPRRLTNIGAALNRTSAAEAPRNGAHSGRKRQ